MHWAVNWFLHCLCQNIKTATDRWLAVLVLDMYTTQVSFSLPLKREMGEMFVTLRQGWSRGLSRHACSPRQIKIPERGTAVAALSHLRRSPRGEGLPVGGGGGGSMTPCAVPEPLIPTEPPLSGGMIYRAHSAGLPSLKSRHSCFTPACTPPPRVRRRTNE